jgi:cob(I)alamin adenosyltransferase
LVGGQWVPKDDVRLEAYGTVDELNATLGLARAAAAPTPAAPWLDSLLAELQNDLFVVGSDLATQPADRWAGMRRVVDADIERLEGHIDRLNADLPPLREFILPAGGPVSANLHLARTVCRRAERRVVTLVRAEPATEEACTRYLNRLSDLLFVLSRAGARAAGEPEVYWQR